MKHILSIILVCTLSIIPCIANDSQKVNQLVEGFFKSKEQGDNLWFGNNLSSDSVKKIKRMFTLIQGMANKKDDEELPDFSEMTGGELYEKLVELGRAKVPSMGKPWTGAKFRLIGLLDDGDDTKYAMYEARWTVDDSLPIRKVSYFKIVRDGEDWKIGLVSDIDRAVDQQIKHYDSSKN